MKRQKKILIMAIVTILLLTGCAGSSEIEEPADDFVFEVLETQEHDVTAYVHGNHWHGGIPWIKEGDNVLLSTYIEDAEGNILDVDGSQYAVNARLTEGCEVLSFECHGDFFHLAGEEVGETRIVLQLLHEDGIAYETPSIPVRVIE